MNEYKTIGDLAGGGIRIDPEAVILLKILEDTNPCGQVYYEIDGNTAVSYSLKLNLLTYNGLSKLRANTRIIGLPISMASPGYWTSREELFEILGRMKGLTLVINAREMLPGSVPTLPTYILKNSFRDLEEYLGALRSSYRRRLRLALGKRELLHIQEIVPIDFSKEHYKLYCKVKERSEYPLEILPIEFFRKYPARIMEFRDSAEEKLLAFVQIKRIDDRLVFMFCGFDEKDVRGYDLYWNMLLTVLEEGFIYGVKEIEFGQTSGETKLKLGCHEEKRFMLVYHNNSVIRSILRLAAPMFAYRECSKTFNVFRQEGLL